MDIAGQFEQVRIFLAEYGFIAILEQLPVAAVAAIKRHGITGKQTAHQGGEGNICRAAQDMCMLVIKVQA